MQPAFDRHGFLTEVNNVYLPVWAAYCHRFLQEKKCEFALLVWFLYLKNHKNKNLPNSQPRLSKRMALYIIPLSGLNSTHVVEHMSVFFEIIIIPENKFIFNQNEIVP